MISSNKVLLLFKPNSLVAASYKDALEFENRYDVTVMDDPVLVLIQLKNNPSLYDIILLEIKLPKMDGVTTMEWLIATKITTPIIITSFHLPGEEGKKIEKKGAFRYIPSPSDLENVFEIFEDALEYNRKITVPHSP